MSNACRSYLQIDRQKWEKKGDHKQKVKSDKPDDESSGTEETHPGSPPRTGTPGEELVAEDTDSVASRVGNIFSQDQMNVRKTV